MHAVVQAQASEVDRTFSTLGAAFVSDPLVRWMFPEPHRYLTYFPQVLTHFAGGALKHASAYRTAGFEAAALWLPPGVHPDDEALGAVMQEGVEGPLLEEVFAFFEQVSTSHPPEDHWYLPVIGVDPVRQGQGYGSALLTATLQVIDRDHAVAYLESSNPRNVPLYERFGFEVIRELQVGSSPPIWPMLRSAR